MIEVEKSSHQSRLIEQTRPECVKTAEGPRCKIAIVTNNVEMDDRGYVYMTDRAKSGLHILEPTGEVRSISNLR